MLNNYGGGKRYPHSKSGRFHGDEILEEIRNADVSLNEALLLGAMALEEMDVTGYTREQQARQLKAAKVLRQHYSYD